LNQFRTVKQAKDYLAGRIADEAAREGIPLSETERKILYFSETDWTLPDMAQVSAEFDQNYDQDEYEQKIGGLVRAITLRDRSQDQVATEAWDEAVVKLSEGDNYLSVLVGNTAARASGLHGYLPTLEVGRRRPPHDIAKLWITAFGVVFGAILIAAVGDRAPGSIFGVVANWIIDRSRLPLIILAALILWSLWSIRKYLKPMLKGLLKRP
jgi:hypothetical protein